MIHVFIGYDQRQPLAYNVCASSIIRHAKQPVSITPLNIATLPIKRKGLTDFTYSRFLVPHLCDYLGQAIFLDADTLLLADIGEMLLEVDRTAPVCVVKHPEHKFEWPSVMVFNNALCRKLTVEQVEFGDPFSFDWARNLIGDLPREWNHLVGYDAPRSDAKLVHFTQGIPCFPETKGCEYSKAWHKEHGFLNSSVSWPDMMGKSVHAKPVLARLAREVAEYVAPG